MVMFDVNSAWRDLKDFSDCDCDSSYCNKWVVQDSMEVFTLCNCNNITNSYVAHFSQKQIAVAISNKTHSVNEP